MTIFCTYCSARKREVETPIPAIQLYRSERILNIYKAAELIGLPCFIMSGEFGLIKAETPIPYYDHLLQNEEVDDHAALMAKQIKAHHISDIIFFSVTIEADPNLIPYINSITSAAQQSDCHLKIVHIDLTD